MASSSGTGGPSFDRVSPLPSLIAVATLNFLIELSTQRIIVYPQYIDSNRTVAEGRVIPKDLGNGHGQQSF
jgi:hypothetical protein